MISKLKPRQWCLLNVEGVQIAEFYGAVGVGTVTGWPVLLVRLLGSNDCSEADPGFGGSRLRMPLLRTPLQRGEAERSLTRRCEDFFTRFPMKAITKGPICRAGVCIVVVMILSGMLVQSTLAQTAIVHRAVVADVTDLSRLPQHVRNEVVVRFSNGTGPTVSQPSCSLRAQSLPQPSFRSGIELVSVTAVVRDLSGKFVPELTRDDFEIFDEGEQRPVVEFWADNSAAVSLALLLDVSGSMRIGSKMVDARRAANRLLANLHTGHDEGAIFAFDSRLRVVEPYSTDRTRLNLLFLQRLLGRLNPFGATSLYDAIAEAARLVAARTTRHRAIVVLSDGVDTRSELTAPEVSGIASQIDVPVYLIAVMSPLDHPDAPTASEMVGVGASQLQRLARWTGGGVYFVTSSPQAVAATSQLLAELRQQYVLAFEPVGRPGWRRIEVRVHGRKVSTRSAYQAKE